VITEIYAGSSDGNLYAINPDGSVRWNYESGERITVDPAIGKDGTIYFGSEDGTFYALTDDGSHWTQKWSAALGSDETPAIGSDGTIYLCGRSGNKDRLYALKDNGDSHTVTWHLDFDSICTAPSIDANRVAFLGVRLSGEYAVFGVVSSANIKGYASMGDSTPSRPVIADSAVYFSGFDNYVYALGP